MFNRFKVSFPKTTVFDGYFGFPLDDKSVLEIFTDILNSNLFPDDAWGYPGNDNLEFNIAIDKSGVITHQERLRARQKTAQELILYLKNNRITCCWKNADHDTNTLIFMGLNSKADLIEKLDNLFPVKNLKIENPQEILDILNSWDEGTKKLQHDDNFLSIIQGSALDKLLNDPAVRERFDDVASNYGLIYGFYAFEEEGICYPPIIFYSDKKLYEEKVQTIKTEMQEMIQDNKKFHFLA